MQLNEKHAQAIEEVLEAYKNHDEVSVWANILDESLPLYESIWITAEACKHDWVECHRLARLIYENATQLWADRERLCKKMGDINQVVRELSTKTPETACCLVALICDWRPSCSDSFSRAMEYLHNHPEVIGD